MKPKLFFFSSLLTVPLFYLAYGFMELGLGIFFWAHAAGVFVTVVLGVALYVAPNTRRLSYLFLSSGILGLAGGVAAFFLYSTFAPEAAERSGLGPALANAVGSIVYPCLAAALGLFFGWIPTWAYFRFRHVA